MDVKPKTWLVDIDGTLALKGDRGPFDWARVGEDKPNEPVIAVVKALHASGHGIVYVTGRMECCRDATAVWLDLNVLPVLGMLLMMRPDGDFRPDEVLKREIYEKIRDLFDVAGVIDDRAKVVRMWRDELGLTCLQVADGNF